MAQARLCGAVHSPRALSPSLSKHTCGGTFGSQAVLREHQQRRRGVRLAWAETAAAAESCGAVLGSLADGSELDALPDADFCVPQDGTYASAHRHPPHARAAAAEPKRSHAAASSSLGAAAAVGGPEPKRAREEAATAADEPASKKEKGTGLKWTVAEKDTFYRAYQTHGKDWVTITRLLPNKNESQIKNYYQNYKGRLNLEPPPAQEPQPRQAHASPPPGLRHGLYFVSMPAARDLVWVAKGRQIRYSRSYPPNPTSSAATNASSGTRAGRRDQSS